MNTSPKNISSSLELLAKLLNIQLVKGWKSRVAIFLEASPKQLPKFVERNSIPAKYLKTAAAKGFPPELWLVELEWASRIYESLSENKPDPEEWYNINKRAQRILDASNLDLPEFYAKAGINPRDGRYNYPLGSSVKAGPMSVKKICDAFGYNADWVWSGREPAQRPVQYTPSPEHMMPPPNSGGEPRPGSYGVNVDLSGHRVVSVLEEKHEDIIRRFQDKEWALDVNKKLLALEKYAPEKKEYIKGLLAGIVECYKPKKNTKRA